MARLTPNKVRYRLPAAGRRCVARAGCSEPRAAGCCGNPLLFMLT
jgi:hypothetical protein